MTDEPRRAQIGPMHPCTWKAVDVLSVGNPGDTFTREQMTAIIGRDCSLGSLGYGNVGSAIKYVLRFHGRVWDWQHDKQCWLCLNDTEIVKVAGSYIPKAQRRTRKGLLVSACAVTSRLAPEVRSEHQLNQVCLGLMAMAGGGPVRKKLACAIEKNAALTVPDQSKLLELFRG